MKTLDAALLAELSALQTRPVVLAEIGFSTAARLSSGGDITWNGHVWASASLRVDRLTADGSGRARARLVIGNTDSEIGALLLNQRIADRSIRIWEAWIDAAGDPQVKEAFTGAGSSFEVGPKEAAITAVLLGSSLRHSPREMISAAYGFSRLRPAGTKFPWNGAEIVIERPMTA